MGVVVVMVEEVVVEDMVEVVVVEVMVEEVVVVVVMVVVVTLLHRVKKCSVQLNFSMKKKVLGLLRRRRVEKMYLYIFRISLMVDVTILLQKDKKWNSQIYLMTENKNTEQQTFHVKAEVLPHKEVMVVVEMANMVLVVVLIDMVVVNMVVVLVVRTSATPGGNNR